MDGGPRGVLLWQFWGDLWGEPLIQDWRFWFSTWESHFSPGSRKRVGESNLEKTRPFGVSGDQNQAAVPIRVYTFLST